MSPIPLKVALLGVNYAPERSGIAPYTTALAEGLSCRGHDVRVLTSFPHYPDWQPHEGQPRTGREEVRGVSLTRLRHYVPSSPTGRKRALFEVSFGARLLGASWGEPDVVVVISPALLSSAIATARARLSRRRPAVGLVVQDLYSRGIEETGAGGRRLSALMASFEGGLGRAVDGVAVIHDRFKQHVTTNLGVPVSRVRVIRNWTHIQPTGEIDAAKARASLGWSPGEAVVLHAGAMGVKQGLENVIEAARIADEQREPIRFVMLGDGSQRAALERQAAGLRSIAFLDHLDSDGFSRALSAADVLLVNERPGVTEMAVPSKLTSYFSSGRPVLAATDAGSTTAEEVRVSGGGVRVDAGVPSELLHAAVALAGDPVRAQRLGESGRRYCAKVLSEEAAIQQYDEWIRQLAASRRRIRKREYA